MQISLSRIRYKGSYMEYAYDEKTGNESYTPKFDFYYGIYQETQSYKLQKQQASAVFSAYSKTSEILVRHDNRFQINDLVRLQDQKNYDIVDINTDPEINGFDVVTVQDTAATQQSNNNSGSSQQYSDNSGVDDNNES